MSYQILLGDCLDTMRTLPDGCVQTCVTSPPYYGLRCYNGGDAEIGLEKTPDAYVAKLVDVFHEVRRVLRDDGTLWVVIGDSYAATSKGTGGKTNSTLNAKRDENGDLADDRKSQPWMEEPVKFDLRAAGLKTKDLIGIPWMVAFALRADGWWLRSDIIWHKPNPMPESVTDRPTKAHEYIFLLSKSAQYYYDADAIREPNSETSHPGTYRTNTKLDASRNDAFKQIGASVLDYTGRNKRSVWTVSTKPYSGAHFATFPEKLIEPCILAGTSARGCCAKCGAPWAREIEMGEPSKETTRGQQEWTKVTGQRDSAGGLPIRTSTTLGWAATCECNADIVPCTVLDPFSGSGTTGVVALKHGRQYIGCELNADYIELAHQRIQQSKPMLLEVS